MQENECETTNATDSPRRLQGMIGGGAAMLAQSAPVGNRHPACLHFSLRLMHSRRGSRFCDWQSPAHLTQADEGK